MESLDGCRNVPFHPGSQDIQYQLDFFANDLTNVLSQFNVFFPVQAEHRFWSFPPTPLYNSVALLSKPIEFVDGPVQIFHVEMNGAIAGTRTWSLLPKI